MSITCREIRKLPRLARVAFAARCARRVVGLFEFAWPDASPRDVAAVNRVVALAEEAARTGQVSAASVTYADTDAAYAAAAHRHALEFDDADDAAGRAVAAARAATSVTKLSTFSAVDRTRAAADQAALAARGFGIKSVRAAQGLDLRRLLQLADENNWNDVTLVPPEICGPLWPDGPPKSWPIPVDDPYHQPVTVSVDGEPLAWPVADDHPKAEPQREARLDVTFDIPDEVDDETAQAAVREFYDAINELHVASGGSGLVVEDYQSFVEQFAEVLV